MRTFIVTGCVAALASMGWPVHAQEGPFDPENWPATINPNKVVHYIVTDGGLEPPGFNWQANALTILSGGDQGTEDITIGGHAAKKVTGNFLNVADANYPVWADHEFIDILVQVYGDAALFNQAGEPRNFVFLTGVLPELNWPVGGQIPVEAKNRRWNWVLFRVPNEIRSGEDRYVGTLPPNPQGAYHNGGVNGGTIRFEGVPGLIVRVIAFGEEGAFGEPQAINQFLPPEECDPEPETNWAWIDINAGTAHRMVVLEGGDQDVWYEHNVGPANDQRRAVGNLYDYINFAVTDNYLGLPCNDPRTVKICVEFYDDSSFAGQNIRFGPEAYATDDQGGIGFVPAEKRHLMQGTGQWVRRSWTVPSVNLSGVNADGLTAGPRFIVTGDVIWISRYDMAVFRVGDHPLAGQDPLADCVEDPNVCTDLYGNYAELDLENGVYEGLDVGSSGGDQEMIVAEAGPEHDRRLAVRPARDDGSPGFQHQFLNFAIINEPFGPSSQPPAHLAICVTYYDDPALAGAQFKPEVYITERNGVQTFGFTPDAFFVTLQGTGEWQTAYWEITDMKFNGVNQGPQAAARFTTTDKIFVSRVRYAVIRPCGPYEGINLLEDCRPPDPPGLSLVEILPTGELQITFEGTLLEAGDLMGPWESTDHASPATIMPDPTGNRFYRAVR